VLSAKLGPGFPVPEDIDSYYYHQRSANADYGIDPNRRYLLGGWYFDHWFRSLSSPLFRCAGDNLTAANHKQHQGQSRYD
jgi:hypothetical protein